MATSIIQSSQLPDPSEIGLFEAPPRPRQRPYELLQSKHTYAFFLICFKPGLTSLPSSFQFGDNSTALHRVALILDPISEVAQKWSSLVKVRRVIPTPLCLTTPTVAGFYAGDVHRGPFAAWASQ